MTDAAVRAATADHVGPGSGVGGRLRSLRVAAGLTQADLAGERFSKEYVSQIERGKTRPTGETVEWLAGRLGVDPAFLAGGLAADERSSAEAVLARAGVHVDEDRCDAALAELDSVEAVVETLGAGDLRLQWLLARERALTGSGDLRGGLELLQAARAIVEGAAFSDVERAEVVFRLGVVRAGLSSVQTAVALLDEALALARRSGLPCDRLEASILDWRSRCRRRQRDFDAAIEDVELALERTEPERDRRAAAGAAFEASLAAERMGHVTLARSYALRSKALLEELEDERAAGRRLLELGGLQLLRGRPDEAVRRLEAALAVGSEADAARALVVLAAAHLERGDHGAAADSARGALALLDGREDALDEIGRSRLVLGRALLEQGLLDEAEESLRLAETVLSQQGEAGRRADAWIALGDLAARRGDDPGAARHYRNAAEALRDVRF